jgi:hypothetical protein
MNLPFASQNASSSGRQSEIHVVFRSLMNGFPLRSKAAFAHRGANPFREHRKARAKTMALRNRCLLLILPSRLRALCAPRGYFVQRTKFNQCQLHILSSGNKSEPAGATCKSRDACSAGSLPSIAAIGS